MHPFQYPQVCIFPSFYLALFQVYFSLRYGVVFLQGMLAVVDDWSLFIGYQLAHVHHLLAYLIGLYLVNQEVVAIPVVSHACPFAIAFSRPCGQGQIWFCPLWYLVLLWNTPILLRERNFVRIHLYLLVIIHAHVLVAVIFLSGAFLVHLTCWYYQ